LPWPGTSATHDSIVTMTVVLTSNSVPAPNSINGSQRCKPFVFDLRENNPKVAVQTFDSIRLTGRCRAAKGPSLD
jgi:hypothetical protein